MAWTLSAPSVISVVNNPLNFFTKIPFPQKIIERIAMFEWIQTIKNSSNKTKWFYFQYVIYVLLMIITTIWAYGRLEFVRSYDTSQEKELKTIENQ